MASRFLFRFLCSKGHEFVSPKVETRCLGYHRGSPCTAEIKQYAGPRAA